MTSIEKTPYGGWPNCYRVTNGDCELIVTADVGPRVMRYAFVGARNFFKEYPDTLGGTGEEGWQLRGGHRLWTAPEDARRTYAPDNGPVSINMSGNISGGVLTATQPPEPSTGIEKQMEITLSPQGTAVTIVHRLKNTLAWTIELAPWALTMMTPGGMGITGYPPRASHSEMLLPTHPLVFWAFTNLSDPRWKFTKKYLLLAQDPNNPEPQKIGHFNPNTWAAYLLETDLFLKKYRAEPDKTYTDFGCSFEIFSRDDMMELETLGPLQKLEPGAAAEHIETWSLHRDVRVNEYTDEALDAALLPLLEGKG